MGVFDEEFDIEKYSKIIERIDTVFKDLISELEEQFRGEECREMIKRYLLEVVNDYNESTRKED